MKQPYGIYLHIPFCKSRCEYCGFVSSCDFSRVGEYFEVLRREISESEFGGTIDTLFVGGGTPSAVPAGELVRTVETLKKHFRAEPGEWTVECNPDSLNEENLEAYADCGFNRISLGVQSFSDGLLKAVGRRHDASGALAALELARKRIKNVSVDLMLGLPGQTEADVLADLGRVRSLGLPHVSVYGLKVEEGTRLAEKGYRPDEDRSADFYELALSELEKDGLFRYEVSNFARPGFESRHNLKYWRREDYLGFGAAAHSCVGARRFENAGSLNGYFGRPGPVCTEIISEAEVEYETIILALRTRDGLDRPAFERRFGCDFEKKYASALKKCGKFLEVTPESVRVSRDGFYVLNAVLVNF